MPAPVTVVIPTYQRPRGVRRAVLSVFAQTGFDSNGFDLVVVDNDPDNSSSAVLARLHSEAPSHIRMKVLHEPKPGVATARNTALDAVDTPLVAFLDDDQSAPNTWLSRLVAMHGRCPAAVIFGPVRADLPASITRDRAYLYGFFSRHGPARSGRIDGFYGCGNALLDLCRLPDIRPLFDPAMNKTGGEDDRLFRAIQVAGGGFAWCAEAPVFEHVPSDRASLAYTLRRAIAYGQGPCRLAAAERPANIGKIAFWMGVGAIRVGVYGPAAIVQALGRGPGHAEMGDRLARAVGKLIWWHRFEFYGAPSPKRAKTAPTQRSGAGFSA